jgi:hypothetical protein
MFKPWLWAHTSNSGAVANARAAATELSRLRVERDDVELYLAELHLAELRVTRASVPRPTTRPA